MLDNGSNECADKKDDNNEEIINLAIKLHNKVRNLPSCAQNLELRNILKAASGYMLANHGRNNAKIITPAVKILSSAGKELQRCENAQVASLLCTTSAIQLWTEMSTAIMQLDTPLEFQDMKVLVFQVIFVYNAVMNS